MRIWLRLFATIYQSYYGEVLIPRAFWLQYKFTNSKQGVEILVKDFTKLSELLKL